MIFKKNDRVIPLGKPVFDLWCILGRRYGQSCLAQMPVAIIEAVITFSNKEAFNGINLQCFVGDILDPDGDLLLGGCALLTLGGGGDDG